MYKKRRPKHCRLALYKKRLNANKDNQEAQDNVDNILKRLPNHKCHRCNRVFTRGEHLRRHLRKQTSVCLETEKALQKQKKNDPKRTHEVAERVSSVKQPEINKDEENQSTIQQNYELGENSQKVEDDNKQQIEQLRGMVKSCLSEILNLRKRVRELEKQVTVLRQQEKKS